MADNLFGDRWAGRTDPAWHLLGTVFNGEVSPFDALKMAHCDYEVYKLPVQVTLPNGSKIDVGNRVALYREPTFDDDQWRNTGYAGKSYTVLQNSDIAQLLTGLSKQWPVETVGALGYGEGFFMTLKVGSDQIAGDDMNHYLLVSNQHTGGDAVRAALTTVRVVCQNTLTAGLAAATLATSVPHGKNVRDEVNFHVSLMHQLTTARATVKNAFEKMAASRLVDEQISQILKDVYPDPSKPSRVKLLEELGDEINLISPTDAGRLATASDRFDYYKERAQKLRDFTLLVYDKFNDEHPDNAGTGWGLFNAVTEVADWRDGKSDLSVAQSTMFGTRAQEKDRAFKSILAAVK